MRAASQRTFTHIKAIQKSRAALCLNKEYSTESSEHLHRSILPTLHFQDCLPRLPIPKLEDTAQRYLRSLRALEGHPDVNSQSIYDTESAVKSFLKYEGPQLQLALLAKDAQNRHTSYISQPWFDMYLKSRLPLPLNYNPFISFKRDSNEAMNDQATRSTNMIVAAMKFMKTYNTKILSPEVYYLKEDAKSPGFQRMVKFLPSTLMLRYIPMMKYGAYPLDMSQFVNLLSSTRIPREERDELVTYPSSKHIVVLRNGHIYTVQTLKDDGGIIDAATVKACLNDILADKRPPPDHSVAYMTSTNRDTWCRVREHLLSIGNAEMLEEVDSAIFCLVLDDKKDIESPNEAVDVFLHGDGASRWFDKSISLIISGNGEAAINFEHAWGDGVAVMRFFNEIFDHSTLTPTISHDSLAVVGGYSDYLKRIEFNLDDSVKRSISEARERYNDDISKIRVSGKEFPKMHKEYLKKKKISPDGVMQLAIQVGHYRLCGHPAATYESCSTSAFKHGRTETIRSCTLEAQAAAKAIARANTSGANNRLKTDATYRKEVESLIRKSCDRHNEITKQAAMGQGFDRHLFGLRHIAEQDLGLRTPGIFLDPSYVTMNHIILSTSTLASHAANMGGFAPVVPDGFGVGYGVRDNMVGCNITSYDNRDVAAFVDAIMASLEDIYTVLEGSD
ncbi:unnamed protein product [Clavelina lepadiformis]|uniref:Choline/carnitine acyltransferase domain-containing protein n=1 Tax=Clavelina lepadiformis TaxID=159417 RepID=A0ABP0EZJ7_CLALP